MGGLLQSMDATREGKFPVVLRRDGTMVRTDVLVLLLRDPAFAVAVRAYADECERLGFDPEYVSDVRAMAEQSERTIRELGHGSPDAPPWRVDDPATLAWAHRRNDGDVRPIAELTAQLADARDHARHLEAELAEARAGLESVVASLPTCQGPGAGDPPVGLPCGRRAEVLSTWTSPGRTDWVRSQCRACAAACAAAFGERNPPNPPHQRPLPWAAAVEAATSDAVLARDLDAQARHLDAHDAAEARASLAVLDALDALREAPGWLAEAPDEGRIATHALVHPYDGGPSGWPTSGLWAARDGERVALVCLFVGPTGPRFRLPKALHMMLVDTGPLAVIAANATGWLPLTARGAPAAGPAPLAVVETALVSEVADLRKRLERAERACVEGLPREELPCPACGQLHVDGADGSQYGRTPHHTHQCHGCGHQWDVGRWSFGARSAPAAEEVRR